MRKNASILVGVISFVVGVSLYFFFSFQPSSKSLAANQESVKTEVVKTEISNAVPSTDSRKQNVAPEKIATQQKVEKALHQFKMKARSPTGQLKIEPDFLRDHEAFMGTRWKILSKVKAILPEQISEDDVIVGKVGRFQLIELVAVDSGLNLFNRNAPTVIYETRLKKAGIVTGLIKVETENKELLEQAVRQMNAHISNSFDSIQTYFITSEQSIFDLEKLFFAIKSLDFVKTAELDILDRDYEKK